MKLLQFFLVVLMISVLAACSTNSFLPVHDYANGTTLGQRTVSDPHAFSPGTQRSWLEVCQRKENKQVSGKFKWSETTYVEPCEPTSIEGTNFVTYSPYVNGLATPLIQAGAILGASAILADGIRDSASRTTNTNNTSSNGGTQFQGQGQLQGQSSTNFNSNLNSNHATGGNATGGNGFGGQGGHGGNGGNGGNGGQGGNGGSNDNGHH